MKVTKRNGLYFMIMNRLLLLTHRLYEGFIVVFLV